jgi:hypothetical protein
MRNEFLFFAFLTTLGTILLGAIVHPAWCFLLLLFGAGHDAGFGLHPIFAL